MCVAVATAGYAFVSRATRGVVVRKLSSGSVSATCPKGEHVSFGGLVAEFKSPPHSGAIVLPEGMRRTAPNRWTVTGFSTSAKTGSRLTAVAYCERGRVPSTASRTVKVSGYRTGTATATCPAGTVVVGGGYKAAASPNHQEIVERLAVSTSRKWTVTALNIQPAATTLTALAYCAPGGAPVRHSTTLTLRPGKGGTARVSCPARTSLVLGGLVAHSTVVGKKAAMIAPFSWTAATTKQWVVSAYNGGAASGTLDALAYCR